MKGPSQKQRVLAALRAAGGRGITQVDFVRFPTFDGGKPITRVAARIEELRNRDGYHIDGSGTRDSCAVYILRGHATAEGDPPTGSRPGPQAPATEPSLALPAAPRLAAGTLFNPAAAEYGPYDDIDEAA